MKILIISLLFFMAVRMAEWFGGGVKKAIQSKQLEAMEHLNQQIATREMLHQELHNGEKVPFKIRKAIQCEDWENLSRIIDELYPAPDKKAVK